jgi:hypothetical protein
MSDWSDSQKIARLGAALNADSIIRGQIMKLGSQTIITANILDIKTAQILSSSRMQLQNLDEIFNKMPEFVNEMVKNLPTSNLLIGRWRVARNGGLIFYHAEPSMIINFKTDGTLSVEEFVYVDEAGSNSFAYKGSGQGFYTYTRNELKINFTYNRTLFNYTYDRRTKNWNSENRGVSRVDYEYTFPYKISTDGRILEFVDPNPQASRKYGIHAGQNASSPGNQEYFNKFLRIQ